MFIAKYRASLAVGLAVSLLFLWIALKGSDVSAIRDALSRSDLSMLPLLLFSLALFYLLKALRWTMLLRPLGITRVSETFPATMIGSMANNLLPAHLGEFIRVYLVAKQYDLKSTSVLSSVVLERIIDFLIVFCLFGSVLVFDTSVFDRLSSTAYFIGALGISLFALTISYLQWSDSVIRWVAKTIVYLPVKIQHKILQQLKYGAAGLHAIKSPMLLCSVFAVSFIQWIIMAVCLYIGILAIGIDVPFFASFVLLALTVAGLTLPTSPGFFGTIELCFVLALASYGIGPNDAFAAAMFYHLFTYIAVTATGIYYSRKFAFSLSSITAASKLPVTDKESVHQIISTMSESKDI